MITEALSRMGSQRVRARARARSPRAALARWAGKARTVPRPLAALLAVATIQVVAWILVLPPFQGPDEDAHFAYVQHLAETGEATDRHAGSGMSYSTERGGGDEVGGPLRAARGARQPGLDWTQAAGADAGARSRRHCPTRRARTATARMRLARTRRCTTLSRRFRTTSLPAARSSTASTWPASRVPSSTSPRSHSCG